MNINIISYVDAFKKGVKGGGEMINEALIKEFKSLKFIDLRYYAVYSNFYHRFFGAEYSFKNLHSHPDLTILIDVFNIPSFSNRLNSVFLENVINNQAYVHLDNSYVDICSMNFLPCDGQPNCSCCNRLNRVNLYRNSLCNFFLSPMHSDIVKDLLGCEIKSEVLPPFLDLENLPTNNQFNKDIEYLYVGTISKYKGYDEIYNRFSYLKDSFYFIGPKEKSIKLFSKNYIPWASRVDVYNFMSRSKRFVHLPSWKEPMGRTVLEASLCGCEIIGNNNVGALSFDFDISDINNYKGNLKKGVENILKYAY